MRFCVVRIIQNTAILCGQNAVFSCVRKIAKSDIIFVMSVCPFVPHGITRLSNDKFSWNLVSEHFYKICRDIPTFINIRQEQQVFYVKTDIHFWSYLAQFFLKWEMFQTKVAVKIKTHILCSVAFFWKSRRLWDNVEKCGRAGQATDENTENAHCMLGN